MLEKGIYEELINLWIKGEIENNKNDKVSTDKIDSESSSRLLSIYVAGLGIIFFIFLSDEELLRTDSSISGGSII